MSARVTVCSRSSDFAQLSLAKLQEEAGEVAEAYLAYRRWQRPDKLNHTDAELRDQLGKEIADVIIVAALLAHAVGLTFHEILAARVDDIMARRAAMIQTINDRLAAAWARPTSDQLELPLDLPVWSRQQPTAG